MERDELNIGAIATRFKTDQLTKQYGIQHIQDTSHVAELTNNDRKYGDNGWTDGRTMRKKGTIPNIFLAQDKYRDILHGDQKAMEKCVERFFFDHPEFKSDNDSKKYI
jgi:hypothetical protein